MEEQKQEKKKIKKWPIIVLFLFILLLIGSTFAWLKIRVESNSINVIKAGSLSMTLDDKASDGILLQKAVPMSERQGKTTTEYTFTVQNNGATIVDYKIYLKDMELKEAETRIADDKIRYRLIKNDEVITANGIYTLKFIEGNFTAKFDENTHQFLSVVNGTDETVSGLKEALNNQLTSSSTHEDAYNVFKETLGTSNTYKLIDQSESYLLSTAGINPDRIIDLGSIDPNATNSYKLQIWIDSKAETEIMNQVFYARLELEATQHQEQAAILSFADDSWETIAANVAAGKASSYTVGDTKTIDMGDLGTHTVRVANTSECTSGETSETACGFVVEFVDIITEQAMNSNSNNVGGWPASAMRSYVNSTVYNALPSNLQSVIVDTTVVSSHGSTEGEENFTSTDKLYLLSTKEVWGKEGTSNTISKDTAESETRQLDYYTNLGVTTSNYSEAIKQYNGSNYCWWLRSADSTNTTDVFYVYSYGDWRARGTYYIYGVSPAFRIA